MTNARTRTGLLAAVALAGVLGLTGCGVGGDDTAAAPAAATSGDASDSPPSDPQPSASDRDGGDSSPAAEAGSGSPGASVPRSDCTADDLRVELVAKGSEMNSEYYDLRLTNTGGRCAVRGYAGLSLLDGDGKQIGKPATRSQDGGAVGNVVLDNGDSAHAVVKTPGKGVTGGDCAAEPAKIKVYAPGNTKAVTSTDTAGIQVCGGTFTTGPLVTSFPR
ncbi:DUF4232 domain-containing protein [Streptomyces sp. SID11385]|uniref:DUF4232 domain-containing protein n=1 Tax=Streptomyces sp. SID11385 TaxID=2706031 RepID=UPI0013CDA6CA|nr:DUF4232 domain-containing protein [Streptomyces sp. SID11385]NEA38547.1 DUF4232 domain-containing protein [Streptomyces sp. SID11385]